MNNSPSQTPSRFFNSHAHCFTYKHVPDNFFSSYIKLSSVLKYSWLMYIIKQSAMMGDFIVFKRLFIWFCTVIRTTPASLLRLLNFITYSHHDTQESIVSLMALYYPERTGLVFLTMDMEYMGAGKPQLLFEEQLKELAKVQNNPKWKNCIYPFIFCDPRRLLPIHPREITIETTFIGKIFQDTLIEYLQSGSFQGIKIYPALGYFPFDKRMKPIYDFALQYNIPIMTHCTIGAVHFKYSLDEAEKIHPFKGKLPFNDSADFQQYYTHPLNYECLLNHDKLKKIWGEDAPDYKKLKICIGHWGPEEEWYKFIKNAWIETENFSRKEKYPSLDLNNWHIQGNDVERNFSWFSIICDLLRVYPNVYTDISYTLNDANLIPLLKMTLESDETVRNKVLFGTDFYLVSKAISEREFGINIRAALGSFLFQQIAQTNPIQYLSNNFVQVQSDV